ncbi:hypothetical protein SBDP1_1170011 [Syntrophobacter sp. SbD1]|nr:hypothetical protein SBDP1_1170011 [Syntrophobacter sp. SbD1]
MRNLRIEELKTNSHFTSLSNP